MNTTHQAAGPTNPPPEPHPESGVQMLRDLADTDARMRAGNTRSDHFVFNRLVLKAILAAMIIAFGAGYWVGFSTKKVQFIERLHADPEQVVLV